MPMTYPGDWLIPGSSQRATWSLLPHVKDGEYLTDRLTDKVLRFIRGSQTSTKPGSTSKAYDALKTG